MKRIAVLFLALALLLTACGSPTPQTIVIRETAEPQATDVPAQPAATDAVAATDVPAMTDTPAPAGAAPTETAAPQVAATNTKPPAVGGAVFADITRDINAFSLKCAPSELNFTLKSINPAITKVTIFYRVVDKNSTNAAGGMVIGKDMVGDKKGNFTLQFSALDVTPDLRLASGWFDYQFVGLNKSGNVVGRSDKVTQEVTFTLDCP